MYMHANRCVYRYMRTFTHALIDTCVRRFVRTCTHAHIDTCAPRHMHASTRGYTDAVVHKHMRAHTRVYTCTYIHRHMRTYAHSYVDSCTHIDICINILCVYVPFFGSCTVLAVACVVIISVTIKLGFSCHRHIEFRSSSPSSYSSPAP